MLKKIFKLLILYLFTSLLVSSNGFAFHKKKAIERDVYENLDKDEVAFKYCANKVKEKIKKSTTKDSSEQVVDKEDKLGWIVSGSHDSEKMPAGDRIFFKATSECLRSIRQLFFKEVLIIKPTSRSKFSSINHLIV